MKKATKDYRNTLFLIVSTGVRVLYWKSKTEPAPETDEEGFPVMAGDDEFYLLATAAGTDHILLVTFERANTDALENWTLPVRRTEKYQPGEKLVLRFEENKFLVCDSFDRWHYPDAEVFGVVCERARVGRLAAELEELQEKHFHDWAEGGGANYDFEINFGA